MHASCAIHKSKCVYLLYLVQSSSAGVLLYGDTADIFKSHTHTTVPYTCHIHTAAHNTHEHFTLSFAVTSSGDSILLTPHPHTAIHACHTQ